MIFDTQILSFIPLYPQSDLILLASSSNTSGSVKDNPLSDKNKSIFSYGDFRNNVVTKAQHIYYDSKVSQVPKRFLSWDDKTKFNPKFKKDI